MRLITRRHAITVLSTAFLAFWERPTFAAKPSRTFEFPDRPQPMPAVPFVYGGGRPGSLQDFRGKFVLLNVWATWCVPCRVEMPALDRLQAELGGEGLRVVPLSIDRKGETVVRKFYEEIGLKNLGIYIDAKAAVMRLLKVTGVPMTFLLDPRGHRTGSLAGPAEWDSPEMISLLRKRMAAAREVGTHG